MLLQVTLRFQCKQAYKAAGFVTNRRQEQIVASAVIAAQQIPDSSVDLVDSTGQLAFVTSKDDPSLKYEVKAAGTSKASCTCPNGQLHYLCKHQLQILLCASCPGPFSFKASRSASQSRAACKTSTSSAMQGQSVPQASRKPRSRSDRPTGNRPSRSSGIHQLRSRSRGLLHLSLMRGCQGLCQMRSLCRRPSLMAVGACLFFWGLQLR